MRFGSHDAMGIEGRIRFVKHDVRGLRGSGPDGVVEYEDLWEHGPDGKRRSKYPERIIEDREVRNKFTRRGLGYLMYQALFYNSGTPQSKQPVEIIYGWSNNPFLAFVLIGDDSGSPTRPGDAKVTWDESDGQFDDKIAAGSGSSYYGRRGVLLATTTGIFKRVQIRYPNASPDYEYNEMTFFAQANGTPQQTGDNGLDDFVIKSIGLANTVACGYNEAGSQVGSRAPLGLAPTIFGALQPTYGAGNITDRIYVHQNYVYGDGSASGLGSKVELHKFLVAETIANDLPGYVTSSEIADATIGSLIADAGSTFTVKASGNIIKFGNAVADLGGVGFTTAHVRKTLTVANTTSNNRDFTIKRRVSSTEVEVFEDVVTEATPTTATGVLATRYKGTKAFDGRVENEAWVTKNANDVDAPGVIIQGEKYVSSDVPGPHMIGRIWAKNDQRTIAGIRVVFPKGSIRDFCPDKFIIQTLNATHLGGGDPQPMDDNDWTNRLDYSGTSQSDNIFNNGEYGYEYTFGTPIATCGVRLKGIVSVDTSRKVEVAEIYVFENMPAKVVDTTNNNIKLSIDGGLSYKTFTCPNVPSTTSIQTIVDALNRVFYGYGLEAIRTTFGYIAVRGTVAGNYSSVRLDLAASNPINSLLGFPNTGLPKTYTGITQPLTKLAAEAITWIYTQRMGGNFPKPV